MVYIMPDDNTKKPAKTYTQVDILMISDYVDKLRTAKREAAEMDAYIKKLEGVIKSKLGDAEEGVVNGNPVVRYAATERIAWRQFVTDNPGLAKEYTVEKTVTAIDEEGLKAAHGDLVARYAVKNFNIL